MGILRSFARRLLVQAVVSGTVMACLQVVVRFGPEVIPPPMTTATIAKTAAPSTETASMTAPSVMVASRSAFGEDRTRAYVKSGRLPSWRARQATTAISPQRLASKGSGTGLSDVILFDRCRPDCESRDPLLAFNRQPAATGDTQPATAPTQAVMGKLAVSANPDAANADINGEEGLPPSEDIVAAAARGTRSVARGIVGAAGSVIGW